MDKLLRETFKTAARVGVTVVSAEPRDAVPETPADLAHASLALRVSGPYSGIKSLLGELLVRFPGLTVQHLRIQRAAGQGASAQEAALTLHQWLRPRGAALATASEGR